MAIVDKLHAVHLTLQSLEQVVTETNGRVERVENIVSEWKPEIIQRTKS